MQTNVYSTRIGIITPIAMLLFIINLLGAFLTNELFLIVPALLSFFLSEYVIKSLSVFYIRLFNKLTSKCIFDRQLGYFTVLIGTQKAFINYSQENGLTGTDVLFRAALLDNNLLVAISASEANYNKIIHYIALYNKNRLYQLGSICSNGIFEVRKHPENIEYELLLKETDNE